MKLPSSSFRKLSLGLLSGLALATLSACDLFSAPTAEAPSPAAPAPTTEPFNARGTDLNVSPTDSAQSAAPSPALAAAGTITAVASGNPDFSTLTAALTAAGLTDALAQPGTFTVFAPTNAAFSALPPEALQALLRPENKAVLTQILTYHVVPQKIASAQISSVDVPTLEGRPLKIRVNGGVKINDATVTQADLMASNGVIHAIDKVILPPNFDPAQLK